MGRTADRGDLDLPVRIRMLEGDADAIEAGIAKLTEEIHEAREDARKEVAALRQVLIGILVAVTTASILLALNLVVPR